MRERWQNIEEAIAEVNGWKPDPARKRDETPGNLRCECGKLLAKNKTGRLHIQCRKCGTESAVTT